MTAMELHRRRHRLFVCPKISRRKPSHSLTLTVFLPEIRSGRRCRRNSGSHSLTLTVFLPERGLLPRYPLVSSGGSDEEVISLGGLGPGGMGRCGKRERR